MFSPQSSVQERPELLPPGTLAKALLIIKDTKTGKESGATYTDVELRVCEGPFEGRVFFDMIMNPFDPKASEGGKKMGILALTRICEAIGIFNVNDPKSYERYADPNCTIFDVLPDLDGQTVAVKVKVEKGKNGHADKNKVAEWLTPNPNSGTGFKGWEELAKGPSNPPQRANAFGGGSTNKTQSQSAADGSPTWLTNPNA